jgi:hypothetical protein
VSNITFAHYIFQLVDDGLFNREPDLLADRMKQAELDLANPPRWIGQSVAWASQSGVDGNAAQIELVIEHDAREPDQPVSRFDERDVDFRYIHVHYLVPHRFWKEG